MQPCKWGSPARGGVSRGEAPAFLALAGAGLLRFLGARGLRAARRGPCPDPSGSGGEAAEEATAPAPQERATIPAFSPPAPPAGSGLQLPFSWATLAGWLGTLRAGAQPCRGARFRGGGWSLSRGRLGTFSPSPPLPPPAGFIMFILDFLIRFGLSRPSRQWSAGQWRVAKSLGRWAQKARGPGLLQRHQRQDEGGALRRECEGLKT